MAKAEEMVFSSLVEGCGEKTINTNAMHQDQLRSQEERKKTVIDTRINEEMKKMRRDWAAWLFKCQA
jgi:hypothetical protein